MGKPKIISYRAVGKLIIAIFLMVVLFYYNDIRQLPGSLEKYISPIIFLVSSYAILRGIEIIYRFRKKLPVFNTNNITVGLDNIFSVVIIVFFIFLSLSLAGISVVQFFTSISIFAAAIAIVSREYLNAMISGFIITFTNMVNIGDYVLLNEQRGRIKDITLLKTYIENDQGELISINNDKAFLSDIVNLTKSNKRRVNIKFEVNAQTIKDIDAFENEIITQLGEFKQYIIEDSITLKIEELKVDKIEFVLYYTLSELAPDVEKTIRKKTTRKLVSYIQANIIASTLITNDSQKEKAD
jgi:small-conductance mechanosensitive channel